MIIGTVNRKGTTLIFRELKASEFVNGATINELCNIITEQLNYDIIDHDLKIAIINTEIKSIFHFSVAEITVSLTLDKE